MTIATNAKDRRRERRAQEHQVGCCCRYCVPKGRRWPANYVGNGAGAEYAGGDSGPLVAGISYDCYLARTPMYTEGHVYEGRAYSDTPGTTTSPSAAAIAAIELANAKPDPQTIKRDKEPSARRRYGAYMKQGYRYLADEKTWIHTPEDPPTDDEVKAMLDRLMAELQRAESPAEAAPSVKRNRAAA